MKNILYLLSFACFIQTATAQNVGIGVLLPSEKLHVDSGNIKIGKDIWNPTRSHLLKFGDANYVYIGEIGDDSMQVQANYVDFRRFSGSTKVNINGKLQISDGTQGADKVLTSDANGVATWQTPANPNPSANTGFFVQRTSGNQAISSGAYQKIAFPVTGFNDNSVWSSVNNEYTAPATGAYFFDARVYISPGGFSGAHYYYLAICVDGSPVHRIDIFETYTSIQSYRPQFNVSGLVKCTTGAKVSVQLYHDTGADQYITGSATAFSGYRVY